MKNCFFLFYILQLCSYGAFAQKVPQKPNILWITCEDMSANLPSFGDSTVPTPNLSKLAAQGVKYTGMFSVSGVCAPSRSAIITGMYPSSIGTHHMRTATSNLNRQDIPNYEAVTPPYVKCFPEYLRAAGYYCTNNDKTDYQVGNPFTVWDESGKDAHWRNRPKDKPFFSVVNFMVTHESQVWARKDKPLRVDPAKVPVPPYYPDSPLIRKDIARYYDNIMVMDSLAGIVIRQLEEDGLMENTIVFFFSDHGAGLPWYKREIYDRGLHVPLIIRYPGGKGAGTVNNELLSFVDLAPTVLSLAGVPIPSHIQGQAFLGESKAAEPRQYIFAARDRMDEHYDMVRGVRDSRFKYIRNFQPDKANYQDIAFRKQMGLMQEILQMKEAGKLNALQSRWFDNKPVEELYDTQADPYELTNLANNPVYKKDLQRLRVTLNEWLIEINDKGFMPEKEMVALMWPQGKQPVTSKPELIILNKSQKEQLLQLYCATSGASIAYRLGDNGPWQLYTSPVSLPRKTKLIAKAVRYGYQESGEIAFNMEKLTLAK
jgi:arylsulfatase A-like enzyme